MKLLLLLALAAVVLAAPGAARAEIVTRSVEYRDGGTLLEGYLAYDGGWEGKRPGVLVVQEGRELGVSAKRRAERLAALGYVAFAAGLDGKERGLLRSRARAALFALTEFPVVDAKKVGAIGYGFGGTAVVELAAGGADLKGVVSFRGPPGLSVPGAVKARILICTGEDEKAWRRMIGFFTQLFGTNR